jgi:hypothetical protein
MILTWESPGRPAGPDSGRRAQLMRSGAHRLGVNGGAA